MAVYTVSPIARPPTEADITNFSTIRLLGLQRDPQAFGSTYEQQSKFTRDEWRARLHTTFIARMEVPSSSHGLESVQSWVGTVSVLSPKFLREVEIFLPQHLVAEGEAAYLLVGTWVHTDHRRQGLGRRLIEALIEHVRVDDSEARRKVLMLEVHDHNTDAKRLYEGSGFINGGPDGGDSGTIWMTFPVGKEGEI